MGTRHLTLVFVDGDYKVAQYGQWDGYPSGQGKTVTKFLLGANIEDFTEKVRKLRVVNTEEIVAMWKEFGIDLEANDGFVNMEQAERFGEKHPELDRDTGADILNLIADGKIETIRLSTDFAGDSLFCEWAYLLDLDRKVLEVYVGFNKKPLTEDDRFFSLTDLTENHGYYPIKKVWEKSFDEIKALGEGGMKAEFSVLEKSDDEEEDEEEVEDNAEEEAE